MKHVCKSFLGTLFILFSFASFDVMGQVTLAEDNASNYGASWNDGSNNGSGFTAWDLFTTGSGSAGRFIGSSTSQGFGDIDVSGSSFGMFGNPSTDPSTVSNAARFVNSTGTSLDGNGRGYLLAGQKLSFDLATAFRNGIKGVDILNQNFETLWNFNVGGDIYSTSDNADLGWGYSQTSVFNVEVTQVTDSSYSVKVVRGIDEYESTTRNGIVSGYKLYVGNTESADLNNLFSNNFIVTGIPGLQLTGTAGFRMFSSPVAATYSSFLTPLWTQATTGGDTDQGSPNTFTWNTSTAQWTGVINLLTTPSAGTGFLTYVYADDDYDGTPDPFPKTISVSGTENSGNVAPILNTADNGFTLVGNPYASTIDFDDVTKEELTGVAYVWDHNSTSWKSWNGTEGDITGGLITPFQGFFVQNAASVTSPSITIEEADKSTGGTFLGKEVASENSVLRFEISGNGLLNSTWLQFSENGSAENQVAGDALKLEPLSENYAQIAIQKNETLLDISVLPITLSSYSLPLDITATESGVFTLSATDFSIPGDLEVIFHDYTNGSQTEVNEDFVYDVNIAKAKANPVPLMERIQSAPMKAKGASSSFYALTVRSKTTVSNETDGAQPEVFTLNQNYPNPFNPTTNISFALANAGNVELSMYNVMGQKVATVLNEHRAAGSYQVTFDASSLSSGIYYYRLQSAGQVLTRKMTLIK